jgi:hypothetical protein
MHAVHRNTKSILTGEWFLTNRTSDGTLKLVLKRGTVSVFRGGLTGRLSLFPDNLPPVAFHA